MRRAPRRPTRACAWVSTSSQPSRRFSTRLMARARAAVSPRSSASTTERVVMRSYKVISPYVLRAVEDDGFHWSGPYGDALHVRRGRGQDVEFETVQDEPLARARDAPQRLHEEPADRLRSARGWRRPERFGQRRHRSVAHELHDP